jgi:dynein heavy chain 1
LTLAEALNARLGGNPFGPAGMFSWYRDMMFHSAQFFCLCFAGTGKTETVKALASQLGRFCLVFNCDESFDFQAMGRLFVGLCQVGAWGCFDEFNRLEERILSAVSQQILTIQTGLREGKRDVLLLNQASKLNPAVGIFITMNPGYAGRSNLPDNLKSLFRGIAMIHPDRRLISQVMLYSQGFRTAEDLASKVVLLFSLCNDQLSSQFHYDFGLRALKSVLRSAGSLKRTLNSTEGSSASDHLKVEPELLLRSIGSTVIPKLVADDVPLFSNLLASVFQGVSLQAIAQSALREQISKACAAHHFVESETWISKIMQLYDIAQINHGIILVGPAASGKSSAWRLLCESQDKVDGIKTEFYTIDPKSMSKDELYGSLDATTMEWTDGVFTHILRKIIDNLRGEQSKRHWIVFDGDVDPEWAENLNSVLDDNKILTLPNGERLALTDNIRIIFEVQDLRFATLATVSRCGMAFFADHTISPSMLCHQRLSRLRHEPIKNSIGQPYRDWASTQSTSIDLLESFFSTAPLDSNADGMVLRALEAAATFRHIMKFSPFGAIESLISLLRGAISKILEFNEVHSDFPLNASLMQMFMQKSLLLAVCWSFGGSLPSNERTKFCQHVQALAPFESPVIASRSNSDDDEKSLLDYFVNIENGAWEEWSNRVVAVDIETHKVTSPELVIETVDTVRHSDLLSTWMSDHKPLILCGPPGSGKSMTLTSVLSSLPDCDLVTLNFSSSTQPNLLFRTFDHYCKYEKTSSGIILRPASKTKWLVIFCDEINLPAEDAYGTQKVITFMRSIVELGGFWRPSDHSFITLERIQLIGACNPPTDAGRVVLSNRFLRHCPLIMIDFPAPPSLRQIYRTFNRALLKLTPSLRVHCDALTDAMIDVYTTSQKHFLPEQQPHYIYSPRELSRWVRGMYEALRSVESGGAATVTSIQHLVRLWLHEGLRLFCDRLVTEADRQWMEDQLDTIARFRFPFDLTDALKRPVLMSNWISKSYSSVDQESLRAHIKGKLHVFREEEVDVRLVVFDEVIEHILRIDRVLRQPLGHLLLVGNSGSGKTVLSRFVAWMNGMSIFQIKVHKNYTSKDFDKDLRTVLIRAGAKQEKIAFIFDESNVLESAFLERMNALLASGEVPGLFEDADFKNLIQECKEALKREQSSATDITEEALYLRFCREVQRNLHVVFTMNPANPDFQNRSATSPALFNRCVVDWFGEWSPQALVQVGFEFTRNLDFGEAEHRVTASDEAFVEICAAADETVPIGSKSAHKLSIHQGIVASMVYIHRSIHDLTAQLAKRGRGFSTYVTPRHYLDMIKHFVTLGEEKRNQLEEQQRHLNSGLRKLVETQQEVLHLQDALNEKKKDLEVKNRQANEKLEQMMVDQKRAEQKRDQSLKLGEDISKREAAITERRHKVSEELSNVEPMLQDAKKSVQNIKRENLDELRALNNPPSAIKLALEAVLLILGEECKDWADIKKALRRPEFIGSILSFDANTLNDKTRQKLKKGYLDNAEFTFDVVNRASKAAGPMVKWVHSTAIFSEICAQVEPLNNELRGLESEFQMLQVQQSELTKMVDELQQSIAGYKDEYAALISQSEAIKAQVSTVGGKLERSVSLLHNLSAERERWDSESQNFSTQMRTLLGDCMLSAAFLTYSGFFNLSYRQILLQRWQDKLDQLNIVFRSELAFVDYLSQPSDRLLWQANSLPADDLCTENAIILSRFNRYPLIIDPSGQATQFLMLQFASRKIQKTSFLDDAFMKTLESALRFGNALLIEDVETIDPVLNSVLNRETQRVGGRVLIRLGGKDIDFSPSFTLFLVTRDNTCSFAPDLCSRVTFVNFTVTPSSLRSQCLTKILKAERPDIDRQQSEHLKQQGIFRVQLRELEESLLTALSSVQNNILDDDKIMTSLETLKKQANDVAQKVAANEVAMEESAAIASHFLPFARVCSKIYFSLERLSECNSLYQFSLKFFLDIVDRVLAPQSQTNGQTRLQYLDSTLFRMVFQRVTRSLLSDDHAAFASRLAQICAEVRSEVDPFSFDDLEFLLKDKISANAVQVSASVWSAFPLPQAQQIEFARLLVLPAFARVVSHIQQHSEAWSQFVTSGSTSALPSGWEVSEAQSFTTAFHHMLLVKAIRPDRLNEFALRFAASILGQDCLQSSPINLQTLLESECSAQSPLLLLCKPGYDASGAMDALGAKMPNFVSLAMGSEEGFVLAESTILQAAKRGSCVLLKNVHLSPAWLSSLEKRLHRLIPHPDFRLVLTSEIHPNLPSSLLSVSTRLIFEPPTGIRASLQRTFAALNSSRVNRAPAERSRIYFLLAWFHAVVLERLRYVPVGWSKAFEFSENDQQCAWDVFDGWIDSMFSAGNVPANIAPHKLPWQALRTMLQDYTHGGRIDNEFDAAKIRSFINSLFVPNSFDSNFVLATSFENRRAEGSALVTLPDLSGYDQFKAWIDNEMPDIRTPELLGLPAQADTVLQVQLGQHFVRQFHVLQENDADDLVATSASGL